jgi:hypothetical protein
MVGTWMGSHDISNKDLVDKYLIYALVLSLLISQFWELIKIQIFELEKDAFIVKSMVSILQLEANQSESSEKA